MHRFMHRHNFHKYLILFDYLIHEESYAQYAQANAPNLCTMLYAQVYAQAFYPQLCISFSSCPQPPVYSL